ncbi:NAD(P)H-quinone oxidoreductase [Limnobacter humi]|uniref:NAD(P)H-quinone oxidoreductase n=1 Tax=Limnobacter humi TaxID=1778671 RepID=A0ABT1WI87_9BURK|nr:NAD(P)H-quinone oxidoreductase [Limnobacter humi]MCQ8897235.1 NAD(P)H-quinone oxidoreductase [Limnobacter humi]
MRTMKGIVVKAPGGVDQLELVDLPMPSPGPSEVLIQVKAAGVNRPDILQRLGLYPPPAGANPHLGLEVAGQVVETGEGVDPAFNGQAVMALCNGGGYAQYVCVPAAQCMSIPQGLSFTQAASLPEVYMTVWQNLVIKGGLKTGDTVLVHGGSSGIGTAAIQLCKRLGARVMVTVGQDSKVDVCTRLGADAVVNYRAQNWVDAALRFSDGRGVDLVLDMVAGPYLDKDLDCLAVEGKILVIALLGGRTAELDASKLLMKRAVLTGTTLRPQSAGFKAALAAAVSRELSAGFEQGHYHTVVHSEFDLADVAQAHRLMESGDLVGKVVLRIA